MIRNFVRLAGTPENSKRSTTRRSGSKLTSTRLRKSPDQKGRIKIGAFDPIVGVGHPPLAECCHDIAQALAGRCEPVLVTGSVTAWPAFNHTMVLELTQPRDQDCPGNQRHAAMDVVEGVHASHHFAHDERSPAGGEDL
jgi:hypothetical protein